MPPASPTALPDARPREDREGLLLSGQVHVGVAHHKGQPDRPPHRSCSPPMTSTYPDVLIPGDGQQNSAITHHVRPHVARLPPASTVLLRQDGGSGLSPPLEQQAPHGAHSGKHKAHGVNVQVITDPAGRLIWVSPAVPGARQDLAAAREHGMLDALTTAQVHVLADRGYQGAGPAVTVPQRPRRKDPDTGNYRPLSQNQKDVNTAHARLRGPGERANAQLKSWKSCGRSGPARAGRPPWSTPSRPSSSPDDLNWKRLREKAAERTPRSRDACVPAPSATGL